MNVSQGLLGQLLLPLASRRHLLHQIVVGGADVLSLHPVHDAASILEQLVVPNAHRVYDVAVGAILEEQLAVFVVGRQAFQVVGELVQLIFEFIILSILLARPEHAQILGFEVLQALLSDFVRVEIHDLVRSHLVLLELAALSALAVLSDDDLTFGMELSLVQIPAGNVAQVALVELSSLV